MAKKRIGLKYLSPFGHGSKFNHFLFTRASHLQYLCFDPLPQSCTPSEHPTPTTKIGPKLGEFTYPKISPKTVLTTTATCLQNRVSSHRAEAMDLQEAFEKLQPCLDSGTRIFLLLVPLPNLEVCEKVPPAIGARPLTISFLVGRVPLK